MAMTMNGEVQLAASREAVWDKLNDPAVLKACIPGCEELEKTEGENGFRAVAKMKVGPVSARFIHRPGPFHVESGANNWSGPDRLPEPLEQCLARDWS